MSKVDGMNYAPEAHADKVVGPGEFPFAAIALDHGHINGMCTCLIAAGAELKWVYDPDTSKAQAFADRFGAKVARSEEEAMEDPAIKLIASAAIPCDRGALGLRALDHGKDYFTDKSPFTTLDQLAQAKAKVAETNLKWFVYYSERLNNESAVFAGKLVKDGAIGKVIQVANLAPHNLNAPSRPEWFFQKEKYGGIICDIGSHQMEQFLYYADVKDAEVSHARAGNMNHPEYPGLEDFGDSVLVGDNGATHYMRVDWFTPAGLGVWGDGRVFILGTEGYIEIRKYIDICRSNNDAHVYLVNGDKQEQFDVKGKVGYPFFGEFILDCINRTENAMTQAHAFKAGELCMKAQIVADAAGG
jgi:predicted dehydrogenase